MGICTGNYIDIYRAVYRAVLVYQCCMLVKLQSSVLSFKQSFKQIFKLKGETHLDPPCILRTLFTVWAELLQRLWQSIQQSFCRAFTELLQSFVWRFVQSFYRAFAELLQSFSRASVELCIEPYAEPHAGICTGN